MLILPTFSSHMLYHQHFLHCHHTFVPALGYFHFDHIIGFLKYLSSNVLPLIYMKTKSESSFLYLLCHQTFLIFYRMSFSYVVTIFLYQFRFFPKVNLFFSIKQNKLQIQRMNGFIFWPNTKSQIWVFTSHLVLCTSILECFWNTVETLNQINPLYNSLK